MNKKDWIIISAIGLGVLLLARKVLGADSPESNPEIPLTLKNANPAQLPIASTINSDELRVMQYADIMMYEGQKQGMDPAIIAGVMRAESSGIANERAYESKVNDYSYGLMQILSSTANWLKTVYIWLRYNGDPSSLFIPDVSIEIGTAYLKRNLDIYTLRPKIHPITDMIAAYNAGQAFVNEFTYTNSKGDPVVQTYVDRVMEFKFRFHMMFEYLYPNYISQFPPAYWGH